MGVKKGGIKRAAARSVAKVREGSKSLSAQSSLWRSASRAMGGAGKALESEKGGVFVLNATLLALAYVALVGALSKAGLADLSAPGWLPSKAWFPEWLCRDQKIVGWRMAQALFIAFMAELILFDWALRPSGRALKAAGEVSADRAQEAKTLAARMEEKEQIDASAHKGAAGPGRGPRRL